MGDRKVIDPRQQFSKWLARWTAVFWFAYLTWLSIVMIIRPETALYCIYMGAMVTIVMIFMTVAYTRNSVAEKMALTLLDKTKLELTLGNNQKGGEADEESSVTEGESNG